MSEKNICESTKKATENQNKKSEIDEVKKQKKKSKALWKQIR